MVSRKDEKKRPPVPTLEDFYTSGGYLANQPRWGVEDSAWKAQVILGILKGLPTPGRIAEIGCGAGEILRLIHESFAGACQCDGFDISPDAIALARQSSATGLSFTTGGLEAMDDDAYDMVVVADVVEHVENPFDFMRQIARKTRSVVMIIPLDMNVHYLLQPKILMGLRADVGHVHFFSVETARSLLETTGYVIDRTTIVNMYLDFPVAGAWLAAKRTVKRLVFRVLPWLMPRLLGGSSLLVVAHPARESSTPVATR